MTQQMLNEILEPIELWAVQRTDYGWRIEACYGAQDVLFWTNDMDMIYAKTVRTSINGLDAILEMVRQARRWIVDYYPWHGYKNFDNPYFGCRSLEEMTIKKDLLNDR